ncbi:proline-specific peptidase [Trametes maxima]|nr:proline-specific peptidase [Trametes maxima]
MQDGYIPFTPQGETYQTYYRLVGDLEARTNTPIVVLHGGPGLTHDYLVPHNDLYNRSHPAILYDQLGNGRSTHLPDKPHSFWTIDLFLDEFVNLLEHFGIQDDFHVIGHSWGGMMASEFVVRRHPAGLQRLVVTDSPSDMVLWQRSLKEVMEKFPQWVKDAIAKGPVDNEDYVKALSEFYAVHGCRLKPIPQEFVTTLLSKYGENGDRTVDGSFILRGWSIVDRLHDVDVPTLVINGRYDVAQDYVVEDYYKNIPDARWVTFAESSHTPFWEEREGYMRVVGEFLAGQI